MTAMPNRAPEPRPLESIAFLLVEHFSLVALAAAVEPLRMANQLSGRDLFHWHTLTLDGRPVRASNGMLVSPDGAARGQAAADALILCGGEGTGGHDDPAHTRLLREQAARGVHLGALGTGSWTLAHAGLLDGYHCSSWEFRPDLHTDFPAISLSPRHFVLDRDRYTAVGGTAGQAMMLQLIGRSHGAELMAAIDETLAFAHLPADPADPRLAPVRLRGIGHPKLAVVIPLMENNLEKPIELELLAGYIALSRRQLERLFQKHLNCSPSRYYLKLRLLRARQLLKQTDQPIIAVARSCGFLSAQSFSRCYREHFGIPPSTERPTSPHADHPLLH
ncbi:Transcriptional regulator GlxA family, contains an amidase domain and an AraC-type DNA-binding HTH domain [Pseudomonas linyingensis]|uniref:Transcriptional regulator GlxA family, contains an amidase domain and an AraC-type DNA-binding HTH domain n=1 Tax=Pseudomonas linyingensis TaxID=915471 RepID=A0A1H6S504_9PSED|nr:GlxA family transcriptional regulator [Pseudomonas linyingensis]SEI59090.1 Transcriptional regulator GlxA family, contains an amidase domain and an AraC-type DNA-binding HTH domain [Pseudomonas linyingensis]